MDGPEVSSIDENQYSGLSRELRNLAISGCKRSDENLDMQKSVKKQSPEHLSYETTSPVKEPRHLGEISENDLDDGDGHLTDSTSTDTDTETTVSRELLKIITTESLGRSGALGKSSKNLSDTKMQGSSDGAFVRGLNENITSFKRSSMEHNNLPMITEPRMVSTEVGHLSAQLTQYKIKVRALTEILKQLNLDDDENIPLQRELRQLDIGRIPSMNTTSIENGGDFDVKILKEENSKLKEALDGKNKEFIKLKEELIKNKRDYESMLEEVNDFMQHNESISQTLDGILQFLLANTTLSPVEYQNLEKAINFEPTFIDVKMKALSVNVDMIVRALNALKTQSILPKAEGSPVGGNSSIFNSQLENSEILDTKLEFAIETMHKKYHDFILSIQKKLEKNELLENELRAKLLEQKKLLHEIAVRNNSTEKGEDTAIEWRRSRSSLFSSIDDLNKRASIELSKSYQDHVDALNGMLLSYKRELEDKEKQLVSVRKQLDTTSTSGTDLELLNKLREQSLHFEDKTNEWNKYKQNLKDRIEHLEARNKELLEHLTNLEGEFNSTIKEQENHIGELEKKLHVAMRKSSYYFDDNQILQEQLEELGNEVNMLQDDNLKLREQQIIEANDEKYKKIITSMKSQVLDHLRLIFGILEKILQKDSVDQAFAKIDHLEQTDPFKHFKKTMVKLDSVFVFIQTAVDSIVTEHVNLLLKHNSDWLIGHEMEGSTKQTALKMEELRKKWIGERERRKLESEAAADRISLLEIENQRLREQLGIL